MQRTLIFVVTSLSSVTSQGASPSSLPGVPSVPEPVTVDRRVLPAMLPSMAVPAGNSMVSLYAWGHYTPTLPPTQGSTTIPVLENYLPTMPPTANGTIPADAFKNYWEKQGIPLGNETDPEKTVKGIKHWFKSFKGAPPIPETCNTTHQLNEWHRATLKLVKVIVPKAFQPDVERAIKAQYDAKMARIKRAEAQVRAAEKAKQSANKTASATQTDASTSTPVSTSNQTKGPAEAEEPSPANVTSKTRSELARGSADHRGDTVGAVAEAQDSAGQLAAGEVGGIVTRSVTRSLASAGIKATAIGVLAYAFIGRRRQRAAQGATQNELNTYLLLP